MSHDGVSKREKKMFTLEQVLADLGGSVNGSKMMVAQKIETRHTLIRQDLR